MWAPAAARPYTRRVHCPKCSADVSDTAAECPRCGVIFARYVEHAQPALHHIEQRSPGSSAAPGTLDGAGLATLLLGDEASMPSAVGRGIFLLLLAVWTTTLVGGVNAERMNSSFMHLPNLVFHEAGHILFIPLGRFLMVLGGSLTQVLVPLVCAGTLLWHTRDPFGAAVGVWWAGESLLDVAPYINDARDLRLVLLGGKTGAEVEGHDWEYLLNAMGIARLDHALASAVQSIGTLTMIAALVWAALVVANQIATGRREQGSATGV
jgi:hypothetical protein